MKRSAINRYIEEALEFFAAHCFLLPPWAARSPEEWRRLPRFPEIADCKLGWDVTGFGGDDFARLGLTLFTLRNGAPGYDKKYAEKIMMVRPGQVTPCHFHWFKEEDIINRGGGNLVVRLYGSLADERMDRASDVTVHVDGRTLTLPAGGTVTLTPGESITLLQRQYHSFWGESGKGAVMVGEVSRVNDDQADNRFAEPMGRFPTIEEDEPRKHLLCTDYVHLT